MAEGLVRAQAKAVHAACAFLSPRSTKVLCDRLEHAPRADGPLPWEHRVAAHTEPFVLLAEISGDPVLCPALREAADMMSYLLLAVGPGANGIMLGFRRRVLENLRGGDTESAAQEIERNMGIIHFMWRMTRTQSRPDECKHPEPQGLARGRTAVVSRSFYQT